MTKLATLRVNGGAARPLIMLALVASTACDVFQAERFIDPPEGSYTPTRLELSVDGQSEVVDAAMVTPEFFSTPGIQPLLGRLFVEPDYQSGRAAILAHRFWTERFGSAPTIIGSKLEVDGRTLTVVGIAPPAFQPRGAGVLWLPAAAVPNQIGK